MRFDMPLNLNAVEKNTVYKELFGLDQTSSYKITWYLKRAWIHLSGRIDKVAVSKIKNLSKDQLFPLLASLKCNSNWSDNHPEVKKELLKIVPFDFRELMGGINNPNDENLLLLPALKSVLRNDNYPLFKTLIEKSKVKLEDQNNLTIFALNYLNLADFKKFLSSSYFDQNKMAERLSELLPNRINKEKENLLIEKIDLTLFIDEQREQIIHTLLDGNHFDFLKIFLDKLQKDSVSSLELLFTNIHRDRQLKISKLPKIKSAHENKQKAIKQLKMFDTCTWKTQNSIPVLAKLILETSLLRDDPTIKDYLKLKTRREALIKEIESIIEKLSYNDTNDDQGKIVKRSKILNECDQSLVNHCNLIINELNKINIHS